MDPVTIGLIGGGLVLNAIGKHKANADQAELEKMNAQFYREQADFARQTGERQQLVFDRESKVLEGQQISAFAKSGSGGADSFFMAKEVLFRQQESHAIKKETDMNVRLAMLRADHSAKAADQLEDPTNNMLQTAASALNVFSGVMG